MPDHTTTIIGSGRLRTVPGPRLVAGRRHHSIIGSGRVRTVPGPRLVAALLAAACIVRGEVAKPSGYFAAHILAFPQEGGPCEHSGGPLPRIGGSPACFTVAEQTELYLCDARGHVLIAECRETDCTQCDVPALNQYGYVNGKCQKNGWLRADCTDIPTGEYAPDEVWDEENDVFLEPGVTRAHSLEQHEAYARFQALFEEKLECFYERNGVSARGFMKQCQRAIADAEAGKETMGTVFVELMLATSEYEGFVTMMAREAQEQCPAPPQRDAGRRK
eukprot:g4961.t1